MGLNNTGIGKYVAPGSVMERFYSLAVGAVLFVPAIVFSLISAEGFRFPKMFSGEILVFLAVIIGSLIWRGRGPVGAGVILAGLIPVSALVSCSVSAHQLTAGNDLARLTALWLFFLMLGRAGNPWRFLPVVFVGATINIIIAWAQAAGWRPDWWVAWEGRHAIYGTFGNPNFLAEYTAPLAVLSLAFFLSSSGWGRRWVWLAVWTALISILVLTISRSAWLGLLVGLAVFFLANRGFDGQRKRVIIAGTAALFVIALGWSQISNRVASSFVPGEPGISTRLFMWKVAGRILADYPVLGAGPGGYSLNYLEYSARIGEGGRQEKPAYAGITQDAHNDFLQALVERGLTGGLVILLLFVWIGWKGVAGLGEGRGRLGRSAAFGALAAILVESLFGFPLRVFPAACLFLWLIACIVPFRPIGSIWRVTGSILAFVSALVGIWFTSRVMMADSMMHAGIVSPSGIKFMQKGLALTPANGELHFRFALKLISAGKMDEAVVHLGQAMPGFKDPDVQFNLGWIALQKKNYRESITWFVEGLRLYPYYRPSAWRDLAAAFRGAGMRAEAVEAEKRAINPLMGVVPE